MKYDHKYPSCSRTYSTLRIYPKDLHPDVVTNKLKIKPTRIIELGTIVAKGRRAVNGWFLSTKGKLKSKDTRRHIDWILDRVENVSNEINELQKDGFSMDISCYWGSAWGNGGPAISPEQMARLAKLNLMVWWDVYFECDDEENESADNT